jgi:hypothetical protein
MFLLTSLNFPAIIKSYKHYNKAKDGLSAKADYPSLIFYAATLTLRFERMASILVHNSIHTYRLILQL